MSNFTFSTAVMEDRRPNTSTNEVYIRWQKLDWIIPEVINGVLILLTLWIFLSLIFFGVKSKKWKKAMQNNFEKLSGGSVLTAAVVCALVTLGRLVVSQFVINVGFSESSDEICEAVTDAGIVLYCATLFAVYVFLWLRQSIFYTNSMLNTEYSKLLRFFSGLSIVFIFVGGLVALLINTIPVNYPSTIEGCTYKAVDSTFDAILVAICTLVLLTGQITLVALFVYPLRKRSDQECFSCADDCTTTVRSDYPSKSQSDIANVTENLDEHINEKSRPNKHKSQINCIMRRSVVFATIAIATDICFLLVSTYALPHSTHRRIPTILYDVSSFLNLVFVVSSFICWKKILTAPLTTLTTSQSVTNHSSSGYV